MSFTVIFSFLKHLEKLVVLTQMFNFSLIRRHWNASAILFKGTESSSRFCANIQCIYPYGKHHTVIFIYIYIYICVYINRTWLYCHTALHFTCFFVRIFSLMELTSSTSHLKAVTAHSFIYKLIKKGLNMSTCDF